MLLTGVAILSGFAALIASGCSSTERVHPGFRLDDKAYERAVERGRNLAAYGDSPYSAYSYSTQQVNVRVTSDVIIREAACCWPADEIAFQIAKQRATEDNEVDRIAKRTRRQTQEEIKFSAVIQLPKGRDPSAIKFAMRTSAGTEYPPTMVETPAYIREVSSALDPSMPASALYGYDVHFPIEGSPGYPPIGPEVTSLLLIVRVNASGATISFPILSPSYKF